MKVSIIIKALNEEEHIDKCIRSALAAIDGIEGEVILADSGSKDGTIAIASKYPVRIIQLKDTSLRSCGIGAQIGYLHSSGEYVYILDGDMEIDSGFIKKGIAILAADAALAGVGGTIQEMTQTNIVFKRRTKSEAANVVRMHEVPMLMMGGLYKRSAIEKVGHFANPYLHAYEESDLGRRLTSAGFHMIRVDHPMVRHYGDNIQSTKILMNRWRSHYLWGCGEYLRYHLGSSTFTQVLWELKIYVALIAWWTLFVIAALLMPVSNIPLQLHLAASLIFAIVFLAKKKDLGEWLYSLASWHVTAAGLVRGFSQKPKNVHTPIDVKVLR